MFTWLNNVGVKSDKGFIVQSMDRFTVRYSENIGYIDIYVEHGVRGNNYFVYVNDVEFYRWNDGRRISEEKKQEILQNFIDAMAFQNLGVEVQ